MVIADAHADHCGQAHPIPTARAARVAIPHHQHFSLTQTPRSRHARPSRSPARAASAHPPRSGRPGSGPLRPDRDLLPGLDVDSDLGTWSVHETPGHAPSHVVLFQRERRLLISGDHLLGRVSLFFDYGYTPHPSASS